MEMSAYRQYFRSEFPEVEAPDSLVLWIDWRDDEFAVLDAVAQHLEFPEDRLTAEEEDADNDAGYLVRIHYGDDVQPVDVAAGDSTAQATLKTVSQLLGPEHQIRVARASNGADSLGIAIGRSAVWAALRSEFGSIVDRCFCPVEFLPDLLNSLPDEIDQAFDRYAEQEEKE